MGPLDAWYSRAIPLKASALGLYKVYVGHKPWRAHGSCQELFPPLSIAFSIKRFIQ